MDRCNCPVLTLLLIKMERDSVECTGDRGPTLGKTFPCQTSWCHIRFTGQFNIFRPRKNGRHFADDIFKCIFLNENIWIPFTILLKFVPKGPINSIPTKVQAMAWSRPGHKPLSGRMIFSLPMHLCVTRSQYVNSSPPSAAYMRRWIGWALVQITVCRLFGAKPVSELTLDYCQLDPYGQT